MKVSTRKITMIGVMAALVFVGNWIQIPLPSIESRIHVANVLCLLSGFLLGPVAGGLSAGIGSGLFDLLNPLFVKDALFTVAFKFLMAFVCGKIAWSGKGKLDGSNQTLLAAIAGASTYLVLHITRKFLTDLFFSHMELQAALITNGQRLLTSGLNAVIAVVVSVILAKILCRVLPAELNKV